tara:strand:+ start:5388 stop:6698 length:1311 start_codon:yes stop_codon:yes gene_type:complete
VLAYENLHRSRFIIFEISAMKSLVQALPTICFALLLVGGMASKAKAQTLSGADGEVIRGTLIVLGKQLPGSVTFAEDLSNWIYLRDVCKLNTVRLCWVDPWYEIDAQWTVEEVLPHIDVCVANATLSGMNIIINYHNIDEQGGGQNLDFAQCRAFWEAVAPRYQDNPLVIYEISNEPTFNMNDYLETSFKSAYLDLYNDVRDAAPFRQIILFSFSTIGYPLDEVVRGYENELDWEFTSIAYHMYGGKRVRTSDNVTAMMRDGHRVICTEWNYPGTFRYVSSVDGYEVNSETLEALGNAWVDWRDWDDTTLDEIEEILIPDAMLKGYWWGDSSDCESTDAVVGSISIAIQGTGRGAKRAEATVQILDGCGDPIANALVEGEFRGFLQGQHSGITDAQGSITLNTESFKGKLETFEFCVTNVTADGYQFDGQEVSQTY